MKNFKEFIEEHDEVITESPLRTAGAAAITMKINNLKNQIIQLKYQENDNLEHNLQRMSTKSDLIAQQNFWIGLLVSQINLMK